MVQYLAGGAGVHNSISLSERQMISNVDWYHFGKCVSLNMMISIQTYGTIFFPLISSVVAIDINSAFVTAPGMIDTALSSDERTSTRM